MIKNNVELNFEYDMLIGNINRLMITKDIEELYKQLEFISNRILQIFNYRIENL